MSIQNDWKLEWNINLDLNDFCNFSFICVNIELETD